MRVIPIIVDLVVMEGMPLEYNQLEEETVTIVLIIGIRIVDVKQVTTTDLKPKNVYHVYTPVPNVHLKLNVLILIDLPYTITTVKETIHNYTYPA